MVVEKIHTSFTKEISMEQGGNRRWGEMSYDVLREGDVEKIFKQKKMNY